MKKQNPFYIEKKLTPKEIEEYRKRGYIVEDISIPSLNKFALGGSNKGCPSGHYWNGKTCIPIPKGAFVTTDPKEYEKRKAAYNDSLISFNLGPEWKKEVIQTYSTAKDVDKGTSQILKVNQSYQDKGINFGLGFNRTTLPYREVLNGKLGAILYDFKKPTQPVIFKPDPEIVAKQQQLIDAGYDIGVADGIWGNKSKSAWEEFQKTKNTPKELFDKSTEKDSKLTPEQQEYLKNKYAEAAEIKKQMQAGNPISVEMAKEFKNKYNESWTCPTGKCPPAEQQKPKEELETKKLPLLPPQLINTTKVELQGEYQEEPELVPPYWSQHEPSTYRLPVKPKYWGKLQNPSRYNPIAAMTQYFSGYEPLDEEEYVDAEGRIVPKGFTSLQDIGVQRRYNKAYDEYEAKQQEYEAKQQFANALAGLYSLKKYGGEPNYIELELDDDKINEYRKGGYVVEDISVAPLKKFTYQDGGELYTVPGSNSVYRKVNGKWEVDWNKSGNFQPLSKGDVKQRSAILDKQAKPYYDRDYSDMLNFKNSAYSNTKTKQPTKTLTKTDKKAQENFDKNFNVTKEDNFTQIKNQIEKDKKAWIQIAKEKGYKVTQQDLDQIEERGWNTLGKVGTQRTAPTIDVNTSGHISTAFPENAGFGDYVQRGWEYLTNPGTALEYALGTGKGSMPFNINQLKEQGVQVNSDRNLVGNMLNIINPLDDVETIRSGVNKVTEGDNSGYATAGLGLFGFIPGFGDARKLSKAGKTVSKIDDDLLEAYNLAADLKRQGKISKLPDTPEGFDKWLQSQYNQRPIYRVVDVNQDVVNNPVIKNNMIKQGLDPTNEYHVAEYMGTFIAPAEVINRGRRSGGHDELLKGSNKDILYFAEDPSWIGPRYGGNNPYYVKTFADELPTGYKNQVLGLRSTSRMKKNYSRNYPGFDINQVPSGVLFEDKVLSVGPNTITPIIGDKGAKVRKVANIVKGSDFDRLPNKRFNKGGYIEAELTDKEIKDLEGRGYKIQVMSNFKKLKTKE